jgi:signal peptidase II
MLIFAATIGCDRVTKHLAVTTLAGGGDQSMLADTVRLTYAENTGAFLGLGASWPPVVRRTLLTFGNTVLLLGLVAAAMRHRLAGLSAAGLALFVAGGASNLADRIVDGRVVDFLNVGIGPVRTGIFNVADVAIMAGALLVVLAYGRRDGAPPAPPPDPTIVH